MVDRNVELPINLVTNEEVGEGEGEMINWMRESGREHKVSEQRGKVIHSAVWATVEGEMDESCREEVNRL